MDRHPARKQRGFTFVEVMIVVLIMGLLLTIAVPTFMRSRTSAHAKTCQHNLKQILGAKERWAMDNNRGAADQPTARPDLVPDYLREPETTCPAGGVYDFGTLEDTPVCSLGGVRGEYDAHVLP